MSPEKKGILTWNVEEVAKALKISVQDVREYFTDGRRVSFIIERRVSKEHIDIDPINKILYVRFGKGKVAKTLRHEDGEILVDVNDDGKILGIEFLSLDVPRKVLRFLAHRYNEPVINKIHPNKI